MRFESPIAPARFAVLIAAAVVFVVFDARPIDARDAPSLSEPGPFVRGAIGIEFGLGVLTESWDLNGSRERLLDGTASIWWAFSQRANMLVSIHGTRVFQDPLRDAYVVGVTPVVRFAIVRRDEWDLFAEAGGGPSWSDTSVPAGGTRFNYVGHTGIGLSRRLGRQVHGIAGGRWVQLWNNGREGRDRDPDIRAFGGYAAVAIGF